MAPQRRARRGRSRWLRVQYIRQPGMEVTISGETTRKVVDSYCPYCATDIRALAPRRLVRCPNTSLCGKPLPIDENSCPNCTHYIRPTDNFCRICRTNLRSFVRGRGGLYQQINRVPSPLRSSSPPRPEPQAEISDSDSDQGDADMFNNNGENEGGGNNPPQLNVAGQGGFLRVVAIDD
ncbi:uncharacterized protein LOC110844982 [Folsomia candida]|uniref:Uncharacterized protein n=1 Tax=Folsomia candida TaxID=158441 RepID=A0A226ERD1_FOLCA|nr:uncharacterized protein LOC110844982 [Folsomia candida]XP_021947031.1 uncharacterized protein LOC110844982 [Folsomia candida]OXA59604.1 hypothetical protein Fcan01_06050 [Folsomia candida]